MCASLSPVTERALLCVLLHSRISMCNPVGRHDGEGLCKGLPVCMNIGALGCLLNAAPITVSGCKCLTQQEDQLAEADVLSSCDSQHRDMHQGCWHVTGTHPADGGWWRTSASACLSMTCCVLAEEMARLSSVPPSRNWVTLRPRHDGNRALGEDHDHAIDDWISSALTGVSPSFKEWPGLASRCAAAERAAGSSWTVAGAASAVVDCTISGAIVRARARSCCA